MGFEDLGLDRIELEIAVENKASRRIAEKLGCAFEVPLTDEETGMLGLGLPALGVTTPDA